MRTVLRKLGFLKYVCLLIVLLTLSVSFMTNNLFNFSVKAQSDTTSTLFLPFIVSSSTNAQGLQVADTSQTSNEPWPTYTSAKGGYSLTYPTGWTVEETQKGSLSLIAPTGKVQDKITVTHLDFEKPEADELAQWAKAFFALSLGPDLERTLSSIALAVEWPGGTSQQLYVQYTPPTTTEEYLITHGRLVMQIYTNSSSEGFRDLLRTVANSVKFTADGPINQEQLSAPEQPPPYLTIEEWEQRLADQIAAADAIRYRLQTGEVPTHLLEKMSERAKKEYAQMLINDADYIEQIDQQRELQNSPPPPPIPNPEPNSPEFYEAERIYNEKLPKDGSSEGEQSQEMWHSSAEAYVQSAAVNGVDDLANRRGVPTRLTTPIRVYPINNVSCISSEHYAKDTYAIDVIIGTGTAVYGTTQNETVVTTVTNPAAGGWGMYVWTSSQQYVRGGYKTYYHVYAHLSRVDVTTGTIVQPSTQIGLSGNTGNSSTPHLHFQVHTHYGFDNDSGGYVPVDLTPVKGFTPDLDYPFNTGCGVINDPTNTPIVIEANEFQYSSQPVSGGYNWSCSTYLPNHTGTCYRAAIPISPVWGLAPLTYSNVHLTPRISYQVWFPTATNYRVWVCGMGGTVDDDSLHVGQNSSLLGTADDISGYHLGNWIWSSVAMDGSNPYLYLSQNYSNIDSYIRENGMRIDRILLTKDFTYNPTTAGIRCGAQGL